MKNPLKSPIWRHLFNRATRVYRAMRVVATLISFAGLALKIWQFVAPWLIDFV